VREGDHLHLVPTSKNAWSYTSTPQYASTAWCLVKHRDNFTFTRHREHMGFPILLSSVRLSIILNIYIAVACLHFTFY